MALQINLRLVKDVQVIDLSGRITMGEEATALRQAVQSVLTGGHTKIVLNLAAVTYVDSAGIGTLVAVHQAARTGGATLKLAGLESGFREHLGISPAFLSDDEDEAVHGDWAGPRFA